VIRLLDDETIGRIAAGEAIERPASVVKELVENSLDAGARRIGVRIRGGGLEEIEVVDDGEGMGVADLRLAPQRHATSKLESHDDLQRVVTLGFRGEGLASIAAVAHLEITTRTANAELGARVRAHGEEVGPVEPAAAPPGTRVVARDLFANVPVRREFLRSAGAEFARISSWLGTIALAYPDTTFSLSHDGRDVWVLPSGDVLEPRLEHVFGTALARGLIPLTTQNGSHDVRVTGYVSAPGNDRSDRRMQYLFVNGRLLRSGLLAGAWTAGYATFAMTGRHPYGVLFLTLPPDHVDPNVHPTKTDVRLRYDRAVFEVVRGTLSRGLREHAQARLVKTVSFAPVSTMEASQEPLFQVEHSGAAAAGTRILAQLDATYIVASQGDALILVDQHAAHERIAYEAIERNAAGKEGASEPLLVPYLFELDAAQSQALEAALDALRAGGLEIEPFGERTYRIVATPAGYRWAPGDGRREFDVAEFVRDLGADGTEMRYHERVWASLACHSVVRAGAILTESEMRALVERLPACRNPMQCPHGRPTIVQLGPQEIARLFKRT